MNSQHTVNPSTPVLRAGGKAQKHIGRDLCTHGRAYLSMDFKRIDPLIVEERNVRAPDSPHLHHHKTGKRIIAHRFTAHLVYPPSLG